MIVNKYPDETSYVEVCVEKDFERTFKVNSYDDLWKLNQFVDACNHDGFSPVVIIPNLIDAQADRRFADDQSSGLKLVCKFLNGMKAKFKIFHPHNPEVVEAMMDNVEIIDNQRFVESVFISIEDEYPDITDDKTFETSLSHHFDTRLFDNLIIMSSDAGGFKPLMKLCDQLNWKGETTSASKYRNYGNPLVQVLDRENYGGKDILIVDDISVYGGTFKGLSKLLRERNCGKLYLAVSHMTVQDLGEDPVTNYFDKVFTTNSKFDKYYTYVEGDDADTYPDNLEIIKLF